jgi:hypothetical protein
MEVTVEAERKERRNKEGWIRTGREGETQKRGKTKPRSFKGMVAGRVFPFLWRKRERGEREGGGGGGGGREREREWEYAVTRFYW